MGRKICWHNQKTWCDAYMALDDNSPIVEAFCQLGNKPFTLDDIGENPTLEHLETVIPEELRPLEHFLCSVYSPKGPFNIPDLRWELFRTKLKEGENLPPSKGAYIPHLMRTNYVSTNLTLTTTPNSHQYTYLVGKTKEIIIPQSRAYSCLPPNL